MSAWIVLLSIGVVAILFVLLPVVAATFTRFRRPVRLRCPQAGLGASVQVDAAGAALGEALGTRALRVQACSRWPRVPGCRQQCLDDEGDVYAGLPAGSSSRPGSTAAASG
jgi:hypothetical protein